MPSTFISCKIVLGTAFFTPCKDKIIIILINIVIIILIIISIFYRRSSLVVLAKYLLSVPKPCIDRSKCCIPGNKIAGLGTGGLLHHASLPASICKMTSGRVFLIQCYTRIDILGCWQCFTQQLLGVPTQQSRLCKELMNSFGISHGT